MNQELHYVQHPIRTKLYWMAFYACVFGLVVVGLYFAATKIRTHTLPVGQVELSVPYSKYLVGEAVTFTVTNRFNSPAYVINKCPTEPLGVYRYQDGEWVRIHDDNPDTVCAGQDRQVTIPPNGSMTGSLAAWPHLFDTPGKYRVVLLVEHYNALPYQDFEVVARPQATTTSQQTSTQATPTTTPQSGVDLQSKTLSFRQGSITVRYSASTIYLIDVSPAAGYNYETNGTVGSTIEITFQGGGGEYQVLLALRNSQLVYSTAGGAND